jgi:hypothetical protein
MSLENCFWALCLSSSIFLLFIYPTSKAAADRLILRFKVFYFLHQRLLTLGEPFPNSISVIVHRVIWLMTDLIVS